MKEKIPTTGDNKDKNKIIHEEIAGLERPMANVLKEALPSIERGDYDLIIGIDASGRIPTLIAGKFINHVYKKKGYDAPQIRFLAGRGPKEGAKDQIKEWAPKKKVLIVDDTISTGKSIKFLADALRENGTHFDIAVIDNLFASKEEIKSFFNQDNVYIGAGIFDENEIYNEHWLGGVVKKEGDRFARPYKETSDPPSVQEEINEARADADIVVQHIIDQYESQN